ncbi:MAG: ABC transporter ATP-binding protein [Clostridia bacterium]|nr:ABC transporter ATP-binding protein [Clostridia bacterium]
MALIEYRNLIKLYKNFPALNGINLDIPAGRIVGLLGPNGSGKTTLIKLTVGLLTPTAGTIRINGTEPGPKTKEIVAYLPERSYMSEWMTVRAFMDYFADFYADFDKVKASEMLQRLGIDADRVLKSLSKGTKEKVQLVLVMSRAAQVYLLDEPIAGVDPAARDYILNTIIRNYSENASVLISTHLISDIENVLDDAVFIRDGQVILADSADNMRERSGKSVDMLFREVFRC